MAADKIKYSDLDDGALDKMISQFKEVKKAIGEAKEELKGIVKESSDLAKVQGKTFDNVEKIRATEKAIEDTTKAVKDLDTLEKQRIKIEKQLLELEDERAKSNAVLTEQLKAKRKALRDEAKAAEENANAYKKLVRATNDASDEFKKLAAEFGATSKEASEARKIFDKFDDQLREVNDAAKDGRRDVGRYAIAIEALAKKFPKLAAGIDSAKNKAEGLKKAFAAGGIILVLTKALEGLQNVLGNNAEAGAGVEKVLGSITVAFTVLLSRLVKAFPILISLVKSSFNGLKVFFKEMQLSFYETTNVLGSNKKQIQELKNEIALLNKENKKSTASVGDLADVFKGMGDEIEETVKKNNALIDSTLRSRKAVIGYQNQINGLVKAQALLQAAADNENNSLQERLESQEKLIVSTEAIQILERKIALERVSLARQQAGVFKDSIDAQENLASARTELIALEITQEQERQGQLREKQTLERDIIEASLDFLIDDFDNRKTINERIIASDKIPFEERQRLATLNKELSKKSYDEQVALLNQNLSEQGKALLDFDALNTEINSKTIAERARLAGLGEVLNTRLLEVIRERRTVLQDEVDVQNDLNDARKESTEAEKETILNYEILNELKKDGIDVELVLEGLEEKRLQMEIQNLQVKIALAEKNSQERIDLEKTLSEKLLEEQQKRLEKEAAALEKAEQRKKEIQDAGLATLKALNDKFYSERIEKADELLDKEKERESELRELAQKGIQDAENNLAENQKRQAELARQKEKELQRQKRAELALTIIETYTAKVQAKDPNPLASTITDIALLQAFVQSLPAFFGGSEMIENDLNRSLNTGKDDYLIRADGKERIMTGEQNKLIGNLGNWELANLANQYQKGMTSSSVFVDNTGVVSEIQNLTKTIDKKPVYLGADWDGKHKAITHSIQEKGRLHRIHIKRSNLVSRNTN
jgi:hypothetical protein